MIWNLICLAWDHKIQFVMQHQSQVPVKNWLDGWQQLRLWHLWVIMLEPSDSPALAILAFSFQWTNPVYCVSDQCTFDWFQLNKVFFLRTILELVLSSILTVLIAGVGSFVYGSSAKLKLCVTQSFSWIILLGSDSEADSESAVHGFITLGHQLVSPKVVSAVISS